MPNFITEKILLRYLPILVLFFFSISSPFVNSEKYDFLLGEDSIIETSQVFILIFTLFINIMSKSIFLENNNRVAYYLRNFILVFVIYEEISFLSANTFRYFANYNLQAEFNLHNSKFLVNTVFNDFSIFGLNLFDNGITFNKLLYIVFLFIFGYGSFFSFFQRMKLVFLDKKFSIYSFIFLLNHTVSFLVRKILVKFDIENSKYIFLNYELVELYVYIIIMLDSLYKKKYYKR